MSQDLTLIKQVLGCFEERLLSLERDQKAGSVQLIIWDKEHDRVIAKIKALRAAFPLKNDQDRATFRALKDRRAELQRLINVRF